jgi:hypothetical protein
MHWRSVPCAITLPVTPPSCDTTPPRTFGHPIGRFLPTFAKSPTKRSLFSRKVLTTRRFISRKLVSIGPRASACANVRSEYGRQMEYFGSGSGLTANTVDSYAARPAPTKDKERSPFAWRMAGDLSLPSW